MKNIKGNLFDHVGKADIVCITTNGFVKANGQAVMGKGCAKEACHLFPGINEVLGAKVNSKGNRVNGLRRAEGTYITSFPVKPVDAVFDGTNAVRHMLAKFQVGAVVPGWACLADIELIKLSALQLVEIADKMAYHNIVLPRPGCGAGELSWDDVEPELQTILDDRFSAITF